MRIFSKITIFLFLATFSFSSPAKENAQKIEDVKTFDFERIFRETEKYLQAASSWQKIKCFPKSNFVCTKRKCPKIDTADVYTVIDRKKEIVSICRKKSCKYFKAVIRQTGVFNTIKIEDSDGILIKVLGDNRYKEITMMGLDAYISNGECVDFEEKK
jgi:hypothetical protein